MWILFISMHLVGLVGYNLLLRKSLVAKVDSLTVATVMQTAIALPMVFVVLLNPPNIHAYDLTTVMQILITIGLVIVFHLTNVKGLQHLEAGIYSILYNLRIIFTTVLGIVFLGENIIPLQILGGIFIFLGVLTLKKDKTSLTVRGMQWGIAAAVVISIMNVFEKILISDIGYIGYAAPVMLSAAIIMWCILLAQGKRIKLSYFREPKTIQLMVLRAISAYGFTLAFNAGAILSLATYISSLSVIIIVLLGVWLLKERDHLKRKLAAAALAAIGLTVIFIANL
ncbi:MAG: EamA family transporter [Candidatus Saccharimonadales bacterium]